ncbi:hypothetical protein MPSEU_000351400 [Mayamaea pseudoterrestris]|nr:hypothetical protein MPSEU_000351400 [Mayamaea pseudoterrestris]
MKFYQSFLCLVAVQRSFALIQQKASRRAFFQASSSAALAAVISAAQPSLAKGNSNAIVYGDESIMSPKSHGTTDQKVQADLLYQVPNQLADRISSYTRHLAEPAGFFQQTNFEETVLQAKGTPVTFYDSVTGKALFQAPIGRSPEDFIRESRVHGWPSFREQEVVWDNVRVLRNGETVSVDGTHLGHNLPDRSGNRFCIDLVSIAGRPVNGV